MNDFVFQKNQEICILERFSVWLKKYKSLEPFATSFHIRQGYKTEIVNLFILAITFQYLNQ